MNCPKCGEVCGCLMEPPPTPLPSPDPVSVAQAAALSGQHAAVGPGEAEGSAWRDELSARLNRYRSRRKAPPPRYPSLRLPFEATDSSPRTASSGASSFPAFEAMSNHALALDGMEQREPSVEMDSPRATPEPARETQALPRPAGHVTAKIIEFPRFAWGPPPPPPDQLAEPVSDRPRILEVPEFEPPPPALGGITIEALQPQEAEKRPGIDIPLQSAALGLRLLASLVDGLIIAAASALFGFIFWKVAAVRPPQMQLLGFAAGVPFAFWVAYQYLLIVYAASTPGLWVAGLELNRFNGSSTSRPLRRWRVLASYLSAVSLGMGYAWVFLDEDALCWHDRITHTYLARTRRVPDSAVVPRANP
jgi:RDD family protein